MNTKKFPLAFILFLLLLSACAPRAAEPEKVVATVPVAKEGQSITVEQLAGEVAAPEGYSAPLPMPTAAATAPLAPSEGMM
ncbi:MAG: hypothetical protein D6755_13435, partial [Anaerolineae bacterium]